MTAVSMQKNKEYSSLSNQRWYSTCMVSVIKCLLLIFWCQKVLLDPLKIKAVEMSHMDPSEIIVVPLPVSDVAWFVIPSVLVFCLTESAVDVQDLLQGIKSRIFLTVFVSFVFFLMGANPTKDLSLTLLSAMYTTTMAWSGRSPIIQNMNLNNLQSCFDPSPTWNRTSIDRVEILDLVRPFGTLLVAIPFQILQILDHGAQSQRWPVPIILGTTVGHVLGTFGGIGYAVFYRRLCVDAAPSKIYAPP